MVACQAKAQTFLGAELLQIFLNTKQSNDDSPELLKTNLEKRL
jgi:hypothetical protein